MLAPICTGLLSLTLAAQGQAQIVAVRPSPAVNSSRPAQLTWPSSEKFQDASVLADTALAPPANAPPPSSRAPSQPAATNPAAEGPPARAAQQLAEPPTETGQSAEPQTGFNVGDGAWGEPPAAASTNWDAVLAPATVGPPPTIVNPPGLCEPYAPPYGGLLHGGALRRFLFGNATGPAISRSGSRQLFGCWMDWAPPASDRTPCYGAYLFESFETWRGIPDGNTRPNGNNGPTQGLNLAAPLPWLSQYGFGAQFGMSYGLFGGQADPQQQIFMTTGIFRRADFDRPISFGLVYDQMINDGFGAFRQSPPLGQLRLQFAYAFTARNEIGFWGTLRTNGISRNVPGVGDVQYRGISQGDVFWHHKFGPGQSDVWVWTGLPSFYRLNGENDFETNIFGWRSETPINDRLALFSTFQGLRPTGGVSHHFIYDFMVGLTFYPAANARSTTVAGRAWMPYIPVANNGSFLVDTNRTF